MPNALRREPKNSDHAQTCASAQLPGIGRHHGVFLNAEPMITTTSRFENWPIGASLDVGASSIRFPNSSGSLRAHILVRP